MMLKAVWQGGPLCQRPLLPPSLYRKPLGRLCKRSRAPIPHPNHWRYAPALSSGRPRWTDRPPAKLAPRWAVPPLRWANGAGAICLWAYQGCQRPYAPGVRARLPPPRVSRSARWPVPCLKNRIAPFPGGPEMPSSPPGATLCTPTRSAAQVSGVSCPTPLSSPTRVRTGSTATLRPLLPKPPPSASYRPRRSPTPPKPVWGAAAMKKPAGKGWSAKPPPHLRRRGAVTGVPRRTSATARAS